MSMHAGIMAQDTTRPAAVAVTQNMSEYVGTATIDKTDNKIGDVVTLTATLTKVPNYQCRNMMTEFVGWRDNEGNFLSHDMTYTFVVEKDMDIEAVFRDKNGLKASGYFRVRNIFNRVLNIVGNYEYTIVGYSGNNLDGLLHWSCPDDLVEADFANKKWNGSDDDPRIDVEGLASAVIYIEGSSLNLNAAPGKDALSKVKCYGQGTDTYSMTKRTFSIQPAQATTPGYYILYGNFLGGGLKMTHREGDEDRDGDGVNDGHWAYCSPYIGRCKTDDPYSWMAIQPIDEEHFDEFWFGAVADESMAYDGGYWTSMYTGFPYECRDGVEAYYAKGVVAAGGVNYIQLVEIESGIVPAYSPVLLKCQGTRSRQNRLMPLDFNADYPALEGNLLAGSFQLYTDKDGNGHTKFDEATMRVFSCNSAGELGFYRLAPQADGSASELTANKAYLDMTKLPAATDGPLRIRIDRTGSTGVADVAATEASQDGAIYDIYGRRVTNPVPGTLYIRNGRKFVYKY